RRMKLLSATCKRRWLASVRVTRRSLLMSSREVRVVVISWLLAGKPSLSASTQPSSPRSTRTDRSLLSVMVMAVTSSRVRSRSSGSPVAALPVLGQKTKAARPSWTSRTAAKRMLWRANFIRAGALGCGFWTVLWSLKGNLLFGLVKAAAAQLHGLFGAALGRPPEADENERKDGKTVVGELPHALFILAEGLQYAGCGPTRADRQQVEIFDRPIDGVLDQAQVVQVAVCRQLGRQVKDCVVQEGATADDDKARGVRRLHDGAALGHFALHCLGGWIKFGQGRLFVGKEAIERANHRDSQ